MSTLSLSEGLKKMMGEATIQIVMQFGVYIIGLFAVILQQQFSGKTQEKRIWTVSDPWHGKETSCKGSVF